jgi:hypothetical protein
MHRQLSIIRLSREVQQIPHVRDYPLASCLTRSVARASSIPRLQLWPGRMSIPIKTLYDFKFFCLGVFAMCNKVLIFINLCGMKLARASPSSFIFLGFGRYNLRGW